MIANGIPFGAKKREKAWSGSFLGLGRVGTQCVRALRVDAVFFFLFCVCFFCSHVEFGVDFGVGICRLLLLCRDRVVFGFRTKSAAERSN